MARKIIPYIVPDMVLAQSEKTRQVLAGLGCTVKKILGGVDLERFKPVSQHEKDRLRKKYGVPSDKYIVLHVGHINRNRNMQFMEEIQNVEGFQAVVVGSTTYPEDADLVRRLRGKGVIAITEYMERIEEVYQCADCYVFPVVWEGACIEIPLSVLEAMACNLPVVTTRFAGLVDLLSEQKGFMYVDGVEDILSRINTVRGMTDPGTRSLVEQYSWKNVVDRVLAETGVS